MDNHLIVVIQNQKKMGKRNQKLCHARGVIAYSWERTIESPGCERFVIQVDFKPEVIQRVVHTGCIAVRCRRAAHPL